MKKEKRPKEKCKKKAKKRQTSIITVFLWLLLIAVMTTITLTSMRNKNALEQSELYDKMYIESAKIEARKTGTGPFNEGNGVPNPGEDYSEDDNYVRTFDVVKYTLSAVIQPNTSSSGVDETSAFNGGIVKFKGRIEDTTYFTWQEDAWMQNVVISDDGKEIYAEYIVPEEQLTAPGTQTLTATLKARGTATKEGEKAPTPTFEIWMDGNSPDNENSAKRSVIIKDPADLYISGKGAFNIKLALGRINNKGEYNEKSGYYISYGIQIGLMQDEVEISDLRGLEYPKGEFITELDIKYLYREADSTDAWQEAPNIDDIEIIGYSINNEKNSNYWPSENVRIRELASGVKNGIENISSAEAVYDSGIFEVKKENNKIITTFNDFKFNDVFPDRGMWDDIKRYGTNEGYFAVGCIEIFVPYYESDSNKNYDYTLNITANNSKYTTSTVENGNILMGKSSVDDVYKADNKISISMTKRMQGWFWGKISFYKNGKILNTTQETGDAYCTLNDVIKVDDSFYISQGPYSGGEERMSVWRGDIFTYNGNLNVETISNEGFPKPSKDNIIYKYGIYKDNPLQGVTTDELVENADFKDFDWYNTEEEAKANGKITAIYVNDPDHMGYNIYRKLMYDLKITDNEKYIGQNPIFRHKFRIYENEDRSGNVRTYAYEKYTNTVYNENGIVSNHSPFEYGGNLLLIPYHVSVEKIVSDVDSSGNMKKAYDVQDGYVNFVITPHLTNNKEAKDSDATVDLVTLTDTLPAGLIYIEGSANKEPVSVELNYETGETTIIWEYRDWQINHSPDMQQITYKAEIDASLENNTSIENKVVIKTAKDRSKVESRTSIYGILISNLAGLQIKKTTTTPIVEVNNDLKFDLNINNSSDKDLSNVRVLDILPYNSDENTTSYNGSYTVKSIEVDSGTEIYYTTISPSELETKGGLTKDINGRLNPSSANLENNANWIKATNSKVDANTTAIIAVISNLAAHSEKKLNYTLSTNGNKPGDTYGSRASIIADGFSSVVRSNLAIDKVVKRSISGMVFEDSNQNGIKDASEKNLMGIEVKLLNEDLSEVVDVKGNKVSSTTTDGNGYYEFTNLKLGKYIVEFRIDGRSYVATEKLIGEDEKVNSNINEIIENKAKTDVIEGLNTSELKEEVKVENINAGVYRKAEKEVVIAENKTRTEVREGEELEYTIKYTNRTEENEKIVVTDKVPEGTVYVGDVRVSINDTNVLENITVAEPIEENDELRIETNEEFYLNPGEEIKVRFKVRVKTIEEGLRIDKITNRASVEHNGKVVSTPDVDTPVENIPSKSVDVGNLAGVKSGEVLTYSIRYTNITGKEEYIIVRDEAPEGTKYIGEVEVVIEDEDAKERSNIEEKNGKLVVSGATLKTGETIEVRFKVQLKTKEEGLKVNEITNTAEVEHNGEVVETNEVENPVNNPKKEVDIGDGNSILEGKELEYKIIYKNYGDIGESIIIRDEVPEGTEYVGDETAKIEGKDVLANGKVIVENIDGKITFKTVEGVVLENDETIEVTFKVRVNKGLNIQEIINEAEVEHNGKIEKTNEVRNPVEKEIVNTSDINIWIYVVIFLVAIIGVVVGIFVVKNNKKSKAKTKK